jgi:hypothetical protein
MLQRKIPGEDLNTHSKIGPETFRCVSKGIGVQIGENKIKTPAGTGLGETASKPPGTSGYHRGPGFFSISGVFTRNCVA